MGYTQLRVLTNEYRKISSRKWSVENNMVQKYKARILFSKLKELSTRYWSTNYLIIWCTE